MDLEVRVAELPRLASDPTSARPTPPVSGRAQRAAAMLRRPASLPCAVAALAFALRLTLAALSKGGQGGVYGYDSGVYYGSADSLLSGRIAYRDYVLLHPPGLTLILTPFAALGRLTSDHIGYQVAGLGFMALGALNAALSVVLTRRLGLRTRATVVAGLFYALWIGSAQAEVSIRLEQPGTTLLLTCLVLLAGQDRPGRRRLLLAGAAIGAAVTVKIWWAAVLVALVLMLVGRRPVRARAAWFVAGAAAMIAALDLPFALLARGAMWRMVVIDQFGRPRTQTVTTRLRKMLPFPSQLLPSRGSPWETPMLLLVLALGAVVLVRAWACRPARPLVVLCLVQVVLLAVSPQVYSYYADFLAATLGLVVGAATSSTGPARRRVPGYLVLALAVASTVPAVLRSDNGLSFARPGPAISTAVAGARCVTSDTPGTLIALDVLSRDLDRGCPVWIDTIGRTYDTDKVAGRPRLSRFDNVRYQQQLGAYLLSGTARVLGHVNTDYSAATERRLARGAVAIRSRGFVLFLVPAARSVPATRSR